jgi:hypothetical protein
MDSLRIVWRNPRRVRNPRRWRVSKGMYRGAYVVERLVSATRDSWESTQVLAVVGSLQPAAKPVACAPRQRNRTFWLG